MRKILFFAFILVSLITFSQAPQFLNYQGIARDATGNVINAGNVGLKFEIIQGSVTGSVVYKEENSSSPSSAGIFTTAIGSGTANVGSFSGINWANGPYFIRVSLDPTGGTLFNTVGTSQLMSVPYALYAETAGNATFSAGNGITINSGTITNSAPNQTVNISGPGVLGSYPNYTVTSGATPTAGNGISIVSGTITNTAPDQTVTISGATGTYPNFTVTSTPATTITPGNSNIAVTGTSPSYTISSVPSLSLSGAQLSISNGNTVTLPTGTTYTNGAGIALTSGTIITNTAPNQTVTIANGTNVIVNGVYPNYTVNAVPTLSLAGNNLSISGGNTVNLPVPPTLTAGIGISLAGGTITNTAPNQTVSVTGVGVSGTYPNYTVTSAPSTTVTAGNNINVFGSAPNYTVGTPTYSLNFPNSSVVNVTNGINTSTASIPQPTLTLGGALTNVISAGSNSIAIASYAAGNGLTMGGAFPSFTLSTSSTGTNVAWNTLGNAGTNAALNFIGTTDNIPFNIRVNNQKSGRIDHLLANAFFGYQAGNANTSGIFNVAFGNQTLLNNTTAGYNTAIGTNALYFNATGNNNTSIGYQTGYNATGSGNVFLGYQAGYNELGSNKLYIANSNANPPLIYGDFSSGSVGIGTNAPTGRLHVRSNGSGYIVHENTLGGTNPFGLLFTSPSQQWYLMQGPGTGPADALAFYDGTASAMRMVILPGNGNIGIGTTTPSGKLEVNGNIAIPAANSYRYLTPKIKYAKVFASELNSANPSLYQGRNDDGFSSGTINGLNSMWAAGGAAGNPAYFIAQVQLPDSAVITGLSAQVVKNGGSLQSIVELWRTDGTGYLANTAQLIASCSTSFSGGSVQFPSAGSVNVSFNVVNNQNYVYFIRYTGEQNTQNLRFHLATITYQIYRSEQ